MDIKELEEMKELGVVKRKSEGPGKYEYSFKIPCADCGEKLEWCYCAETLQKAKAVMISKLNMHCSKCQFKPKNMSESMLRRAGEIAMANHLDVWRNAVDEMWEEFAEGYGPEPHTLDDGTEFWDCECPTDFSQPDQTGEQE